MKVKDLLEKYNGEFYIYENVYRVGAKSTLLWYNVMDLNKEVV